MKEFLTPQIEKFVTLGGQYITIYLLAAVILLFVLFIFYYIGRTGLMRYAIWRTRRKFSEELMQKNSWLRPYWERYSNTFIIDLEDNQRTTYDARDFFNSARIMNDRINERWWLFAPSLVFLLGLCAIVGQLVLGLVVFDISSSDTIMASIKQCLLYLANGMMVFIAGMMLSVVQFFVAKYLITYVKYRIEKMAEMLNSRFKMSALEERAVTLAEYSIVFREIMQELFLTRKGDVTLTPGSVSSAILDRIAHQEKALVRMAQNSGGNNGASAEALLQASEKAGQAVVASLRPVLEQIAHSLAVLEKKEHEGKS